MDRVKEDDALLRLVDQRRVLGDPQDVAGTGAVGFTADAKREVAVLDEQPLIVGHRPFDRTVLEHADAGAEARADAPVDHGCGHDALVVGRQVEVAGSEQLDVAHGLLLLESLRDRPATGRAGDANLQRHASCKAAQYRPAYCDRRTANHVDSGGRCHSLRSASSGYASAKLFFDCCDRWIWAPVTTEL